MMTEGIAKALFFRLEPIVGLLSGLVERFSVITLVEDDDSDAHRINISNNIGHSNSTISPSTLYQTNGQRIVTYGEKVFGLLTCQVQLLDALGNAIDSIASSPEQCEALGDVAPFVLLPIHAILKSYPTKSISHLSAQSQLWLCQQKSALVLTRLLKYCPPTFLDMEQKLEFLLCCTMAMNTNSRFDPQELSIIVPKRFDRGEEHDKAMLRCLQVLLHAQCGIPGETIGSKMEGNLMAALVETCFKILSLPKGSGADKKDSDLVMGALTTLGILLDRVTDQYMWRTLFPGCSAALIQRSLAPSKASRITANCVERLAQLLSVTLQSEIKPVPLNDAQSQLTNLSFSRNDKNKPSDMDTFLTECNNRLPSLLTVVMRILPMSSSTMVRVAVVKLCRTILMETWSIWKERYVETQALHGCIILHSDSDVQVRDLACETIDMYRATDRWIDSEVECTALNIIDELPIMATRLRDDELRSKVCLAQGYLELCLNHNSKLKLSAILTLPEEQTRLRCSLSALFDIDFETMQPTPKIFALTPQLGADCYPAKLRYLRDDILSSVNILVRTLGRVLGPKSACRFIDACVADLHEDCILRAAEGLSRATQTSWVHEWVGTVVVLDQILIGLTEPHYWTQRELRQTSKTVKALAAALIPVIVESPLWNLPSVHETASSHTHLKSESYVSAEALKGNAALLCSIFTLIGSLIRALGSDVKSLFPVLLYPIFERCSMQNHSQVQVGAEQVLKVLSTASDSGSVSNMVSANFDYLFGSLQAKMRHYASFGAIDNEDFRCLPAIAKTVLRSGLSSSASKLTSINMLRSLTARNKSAVIINTVIQFTSLFDRNKLHMRQNHHFGHLLELVDFYHASVLFIMDSFGLTPKNLETWKSGVQHENKPWKDLLKPFSTHPRAFDDFDQTKLNNKNLNRMDVSSKELMLLTLILARCGYLISHPALALRVSSCKVQSLAFAFLGFIADNFNADESTESEHPGNAIYRQISESWPALIGRVEALSNEFCQSQRSRALSLRVSEGLPATYSSSDTLFLSTLFDLLGAMASSSGSFVWGRLQESVWPLCAQLIETLLSDRLNPRSVMNDNEAPNTDKNRLTVSILSLYIKVFRNLELAERAASSIPQIGGMILPFLAKEDPVSCTALRAMEAMLCVDNDAMWRVLLSASGQRLPHNPYLMLCQAQKMEPAEQPEQERTLLQRRAQGLIDYANSLPEQNINFA